jgi:hypothetical protein
MSYHGVSNWPVCTQMGFGGVKILKGELGMIYVRGASNTCYLVIEHENHNIVAVWF